MHTSLRLSALVIALAGLSALPVHAAPAAQTKAPGKQTSGAPFVTVNGVAISQSVAETFIQEQAAQGVPANDELRDAVKEELVRRAVVAQAASKKGLDKKPDIAARMELARQEVLIRAFIQDYLATNPVTDDALRAEYDRLKSEMTAKEYKSRHILVSSEEEATALIAKLDKGEKFDELAKESKDPGSKDTGGDLGWSQANAFVPEFALALTSLEKGKYTTAPVKSTFGYHVILLEDSRNAEPPAFDQIKPQLQQHVQQQRVTKVVNDLRTKAVVK